MVEVVGVVVKLGPLGLHPPAFVVPDEALVPILLPMRWDQVMVLEEVGALIHKRRVPATRQHEPMSLPMVPVMTSNRHVTRC